MSDKKMADMTPEEIAERIYCDANPYEWSPTDLGVITHTIAALRDADRKWVLLKAAEALEEKAHEREVDKNVYDLAAQTWDAAADFLRNFDPEETP